VYFQCGPIEAKVAGLKGAEKVNLLGQSCEIHPSGAKKPVPFTGEFFRNM